MEITIKINGRMVSVEVNDDVANDTSRADGKPRTSITKSGGIGMTGSLTST